MGWYSQRYAQEYHFLFYIYIYIYACYAKLLISQQNASFISLSFDGGLPMLCPAANCNIGCEKANVFPTVSQSSPSPPLGSRANLWFHKRQI